MSVAAEPRPPAGAAPAAATQATYKRGTRILGIGIASTGLLTAIYFSVASHVLGPVEAKRIDVLWSIAWIVICSIYRPIEQLLSRGIAERRAQGHHAHPLRAALGLQAAFAGLFLVIVLIFRSRLEGHVFKSTGLYWVFVAAVVFYAASYFARGWLAGHGRFGLYGGLVFCESAARLMFALAVAVGIAHGQLAVAIGIAVSPLVSLVVVPLAFARRSRAQGGDEDEEGAGPVAPTTGAAPPVSARRSARFALAVAGIMISEQVLLNAGVLTADATASDAALAGIVFNVLLIARAPLQLFQAVQTSLLPHLTTLVTRGDEAGFRKALWTTLGAVAAFGGAVILGLATIGPFVMSHAFGQHFSYGRVGLASIGAGMTFHLAAGALNQAALARGHERAAVAAWALTAGIFLAFTLGPVGPHGLGRVEGGYPVAMGLLCAMLYVLDRRAPARSALVAAEAAAAA